MAEVHLTYRFMTLAAMLASGKYRTVMLQFYHGLGDAISFYAHCFPRLKQEFPDIEFSFHVLHGQEEMFGSCDPDESHYDLAVRLAFPCSEWDSSTDETKAERCMREEIGIDNFRQPDVYIMPRTFPYPLIGVHFFSTSADDVSFPEDGARKVWDAIAERGLIPIDTHFVHPGCQIEHHPFAWEDRTVSSVTPTVGKLFGLIHSLGGFAGVSGGNFWTALCELPPERILYLETAFPASKLTRLPVHSYDGGDDLSPVHQWLDCVTR